MIERARRRDMVSRTVRQLVRWGAERHGGGRAEEEEFDAIQPVAGLVEVMPKASIYHPSMTFALCRLRAQQIGTGMNTGDGVGDEAGELSSEYDIDRRHEGGRSKKEKQSMPEQPSPSPGSQLVSEH
nr:hypothetical protein CFP56_33710 [Quercus suber]